MHSLIASDQGLAEIDAAIAQASSAWQKYMTVQATQKREYAEALAAWEADTDDALLTGRTPRPAPAPPVEQVEYAQSLVLRPIDLADQRRAYLRSRADDFGAVLRGREVALMRQAADHVKALGKVAREIEELRAAAGEVGIAAYGHTVDATALVRAVQAKRRFVASPVLDEKEQGAAFFSAVQHA